MQVGFITPKEAGNMAGRSSRTIILWVEMGRIHGFKLGGQWEISKKSLLDYIQTSMEEL